MDIRWLLSFEMTGWFSGGVYIFLMILSVLSWGIIFRKLALFRRVRRAEAIYLATAGKGGNASIPLAGRMSSLYLIGTVKEKYRHDGMASREKMEEAVKVSLNDYFLGLNSGLPVLATISSVAPFMGLLGTVWGIMVIFSRLHGEVAGVSEMVAPGVAQALVTTIGGLLVAIPALFFYNYFAMILRHMTNTAENYASQVIYLEHVEAMDNMDNDDRPT